MKVNRFYRVVWLILAFGLYWAYPLVGFSVYASVSALVLGVYLFSFYLRREEIDAFPYWVLLLTLSLMMTTHYLKPSDGEYTNTDAQVFALTGVEQADSILLLNPEGTGLWPVSTKGHAWVADGKLHLDVTDVPVYDGDSLVNGPIMPTFKEVLAYEGVSIRFTHKEPGFWERCLQGVSDSLLIDVSFSTTGNSYRPAFYSPLKKGYNLFDMLHKGVDYQLAEEQLLASLREVLILRYRAGYALTYGEGLASVATLSLDHQPYHNAGTVKEIPLSDGNSLYFGMRNTATHPMHFTTMGSFVCGEYLYPYLYRLPGRVGENKRLLLTSIEERLATSSISEVLFFDHLAKSEYGITGSLSYRVGEANQPFSYTLYSERSSEVPNGMVASNGAVWHTRVTDTRYDSVLTGEPNLWIHPVCLMGLLFVLYVLIFLAAEYRGGYQGHIAIFTGGVMMVFLCVATYVTWRVAAFPPVDQISLAELKRYTLMHSWYNPLLGYLVVGVLYAALVALGPFMCRYLPAGKQTVWGCAVGIILSALLSLWIDSALCIAIPVVLLVLGSYHVGRAGLSRLWRLGLLGLTELALFMSDPGFCFIFSFAIAFYLVFCSSWGAVKKALLLLVTVALALGSAQIFIWLFDQNVTGDLLSGKRHLYYRAVQHGSVPMEEIMMEQSIDGRDAERALEASQNYWFIDYYNKRGSVNRTVEGLFELEPWHHTGVSYSTQISDQVMSRFLVGEISNWFPLCLGLVLLVYLSGCLLFRLDRKTSDVAKFVGVFLFIQYLFVYLSCTNRLIFFGEDLPFIAQTAKVMSLCFTGLMSLPILLPEKGGERNKVLFTTCLSYLFWIVTIGGVVYWFSGKTTVEREDASFNLYETIERTEQEIELINSKLGEAKMPSETIQPNQDVSLLMARLDEEVHLTDYVNGLFDRGRISKFTASLYRSFRQKLQLRNNQTNIVHLRNKNSGGYRLCVNKGFFYCADPQYEGGKFQSNIYGTGVEERQAIQVHKDKDFDWLELPAGWSCVDVALVDFRQSKMAYRRLEGPDGAYRLPFPHLVMRTGQLLTYEVNGSEEKFFRYDSKVPANLLVKHLNINGRSRFYYLNEHMWFKNLSDMLAETYVRPSDEPFSLTLDVGLTRRVDSLLKRLNTGSVSVVALDQSGQLRLMTDYKVTSIVLNPNDRVAVEEAKRHNYLNPNAEQERLLFGNLNLLPMQPGPGSSIKPISYAATMSEAPQFPWESLKLVSPSRVVDAPIRWRNRLIAVQQYGDHPYRDLYVLAGDEVGDGSWVNNQFFLAHSSNLYHGMVLSLGSQAELPDRLGDRFAKAEPNDFPQFTVGKGLYSLKDLPEWSSNSILSRGLYKNFGLPAYNSYLKRDSMFLQGVSSRYYPWVWPSASYLLNEKILDLEPSVRIRQLMLGSFPWHVTPIKMAEMYGKLFSMHPDYAATLIPTATKPVEHWQGPDGKLDDAFTRMQQSVFKGMRLAATEGTARWMKELLPKGYYYYAKTGTIGAYVESDVEQGFIGKADDRIVACVVTDRDILTVKSSDAYRFWVIYVRVEKATDTSALREIVRCVVESPSLKADMLSK